MNANIHVFRLRFVLALLVLALEAIAAPAISVTQDGPTVSVTWPISDSDSGSAIFSMDAAKPLIQSLGIVTKNAPVKTIAAGLNPTTLLTVGERDLKNPAGWVAFFDDPPLRPHETFLVKLGERRLKVTTEGARTTVSIASVSASSFHGDLRFTFYRNSPLIHAESVVSTEKDGRAIIYDTGLTSPSPDWTSLAWNDTAGKLQRTKFDASAPSKQLAVAGRTLVAEGANGSIAVFPAPHQFFYPLDEAYNLRFVWHGRNYADQVADCGFGIRQSPTGDKRHVPWFNAPPGTQQRLGVFYLLTPGDAQQALDAAAKYTRGDRFKKLPGYLTFTSHFHIEHSKEFMAKQRAQNTDGVPQGLEVPGFVKTFKARGVDIAHLAEFHFEDGSKIPDEERWRKLKIMHDECQRLSDDQLLVLPGEEPNIQLGGHWISLFPKPIYWALNRSANKPFTEEIPGYGTVYHIGSAEDVLQLMEKEKGLMWTAHPRIKASMGFPDKHKDTAFFRSPHFLGGAWKAMPADLSRPTLGWRVLDLLDDTANWGLRKQAVGEVDTFRMEPDFETYAHMNINYLRLDKAPRFADGWQPVLDVLRAGKFFVSTGEVLVPEFTIGGKGSGETLDVARDSSPVLEAGLEWTFPLAFAEVVSGDGANVYRQRIDLADTESFGNRKLRLPVDLKGRTWVRFAVWDVAANGAFTQPIWLTGFAPVAAAPVAPAPAAPAPASTPAASTWARFVPERLDDFAWENDLIAFRAYGPAIRPPGKASPDSEDSGIDCWCKRVPYPIIDKWYAGDPRGVSYHQDHGEGNDLYKVGSSRGCGGTAIWKNGRMWLGGPYKTWKIVSRERQKTIFELTYDYDVDGEKFQEVKRITIELGQRLFRSESAFTRDGKPAVLDIAIGIATHGGKARPTFNAAQGWMSCWENIEGNGLGTGVVIAPSRIVEMREDKPPGGGEIHALLLTRTDADGKVTHFAGFGWQKAGVITTPELWQEYLADFSTTGGMNRLPLSPEQLKSGYTDVIPTAATTPSVWRWTTTAPAADWTQAGFNDTNWAEGKSSFGTRGTPGTDGRLNTVWDTKDIWIRRTVQLPPVLGPNLRLLIHHDNFADVSIDGMLAWRSQNVETRDYSVFEIAPQALTRLKAGATITIAAHARNRTGGQAIDVGIVNLN
jgi:hypothetical protein